MNENLKPETKENSRPRLMTSTQINVRIQISSKTPVIALNIIRCVAIKFSLLGLKEPESGGMKVVVEKR